MEQAMLRGTALGIPEKLVSSALNGVVEATLIRRGWPTLTIRRRASSLGFLLEALLKLLYPARST